MSEFPRKRRAPKPGQQARRKAHEKSGHQTATETQLRQMFLDAKILQRVKWGKARQDCRNLLCSWAVKMRHSALGTIRLLLDVLQRQ